MQAAKKAIESVKETAANMGASAKSGFEKTKATLQEKVLLRTSLFLENIIINIINSLLPFTKAFLSIILYI